MNPQDSQIQRCSVCVLELMRRRVSACRVGRVSIDGDSQVEPGAEYNPGETTTPRQAATVILPRGGASELEALLVTRTARPRRAARGAEGVSRRRGRARAAPRRARVLTQAQPCCMSITCVTALISARCVNACG